MLKSSPKFRRGLKHPPPYNASNFWSCKGDQEPRSVVLQRGMKSQRFCRTREFTLLPLCSMAPW